MEISDKLIKILACPKCKAKVGIESTGIICENCRLSYPVRDGIPVMLIDEATSLD